MRPMPERHWPARPGRADHAGIRAAGRAQGAGAGEFLWYEQYKLTGNVGSIDGVFQPLATWFGIPAHEKPIRLGVAILEILASVLVLVPLTRVLGALLALGIMSGAIF